MLVFNKISANSDLFVDLNVADAEIISGGYETFMIMNSTSSSINHTLDGVLQPPLEPKEGRRYIAYSGGILEFDADGRDYYKQVKKYDLADGKIYTFLDNPFPGNPSNIELFDMT